MFNALTTIKEQAKKKPSKFWSLPIDPAFTCNIFEID